MKKVLKGMVTVAAVGIVACAIVHRKAIMAYMNGEPMPEPPAWHKRLGLHKDKK